MPIQVVYSTKLVWEAMDIMSARKRKSPLIKDKPTGVLPTYDKEGDILMNLNKKMGSKIQQLKKQLSIRD
jgi:hypothetical protein